MASSSSRTTLKGQPPAPATTDAEAADPDTTAAHELLFVGSQGHVFALRKTSGALAWHCSPHHLLLLSRTDSASSSSSSPPPTPKGDIFASTVSILPHPDTGALVVVTAQGRDAASPACKAFAHALAASTGAVLWATVLADGSPSSGGGCLSACQQQSLGGVAQQQQPPPAYSKQETADGGGKPTATAPVDPSPRNSTLDNCVFAAALDAVYCLDRATGKELWRLEFGKHPSDGGCDLLLEDDSLYVAIPSHVWSLNALTGRQNWCVSVTARFGTPILATMASNAPAAAPHRRTDRKDGNNKKNPDDDEKRGPTRSDDVGGVGVGGGGPRDKLFVGTVGQVSAFDKSTGSRFDVPTAAGWLDRGRTPTLLPCGGGDGDGEDDDIVVAALRWQSTFTAAAAVQRVRWESGELVWRAALGDRQHRWRRVRLLAGRHALRGAAPAAAVAAGDAPPGYASAWGDKDTAANGDLFFVAGSAAVRAHSLRTGRVHWTTPLGDDLASAAARSALFLRAHAEPGRVFVAAGRQHATTLLCLDDASGRVLWRAEDRAPQLLTEPAEIASVARGAGCWEFARLRWPSPVRLEVSSVLPVMLINLDLLTLRPRAAIASQPPPANTNPSPPAAFARVKHAIDKGLKSAAAVAALVTHVNNLALLIPTLAALPLLIIAHFLAVADAACSGHADAFEHAVLANPHPRHPRPSPAPPDLPRSLFDSLASLFASRPAALQPPPPAQPCSHPLRLKLHHQPATRPRPRNPSVPPPSTEDSLLAAARNWRRTPEMTTEFVGVAVFAPLRRACAALKDAGRGGAAGTTTSTGLKTPRHGRRAPIRPANAASAQRSALHLLTLLVVVLLLQLAAGCGATPHPGIRNWFSSSSSSSSRPAEEKPSANDRVETVGGVRVQVGPKISAEYNTVGDAHKASTDGKTYNAVFKQQRNDEKFGYYEVEATRKAGQLISAEGNRMVQPKVGKMGLNEYLKEASADPKAQKAYQRVGNNSPKELKKPKMSDHIYDQIKQQQSTVGFVHSDTHADNIRVTPQKQRIGRSYKVAKAELVDWGSAQKKDFVYDTPEERQQADKKKVIDACKAHGFRFRSGAVVGQLYRRQTDACSGKGGPAKQTNAAPAQKKLPSSAPAAAAASKRGTTATTTTGSTRAPLAAGGKAGSGPAKKAVASTGGGGGASATPARSATPAKKAPPKARVK
ncbi:hypothetical protein DFJ73DRAFT_799914 [Zopfochytrium polystomum]|nr:hypothetical protein DFJ73DRAFT_799914 [Zopfochytrium polystomum]